MLIFFQCWNPHVSAHFGTNVTKHVLCVMIIPKQCKLFYRRRFKTSFFTFTWVFIDWHDGRMILCRFLSLSQIYWHLLFFPQRWYLTYDDCLKKSDIFLFWHVFLRPYANLCFSCLYFATLHEDIACKNIKC